MLKSSPLAGNHSDKSFNSFARQDSSHPFAMDHEMGPSHSNVISTHDSSDSARERVIQSPELMTSKPSESVKLMTRNPIESHKLMTSKPIESHKLMTSKPTESPKLMTSKPTPSPKLMQHISTSKPTPSPIVLDSSPPDQIPTSPIVLDASQSPNMPTLQPGQPFAYQEVVRDKASRKRMHGDDCPCCQDYYRLTKNLGDQDRRQIISRHRSWVKRPESPPGFWDVDFPSTQQIIDNNVVRNKR